MRRVSAPGRGAKSMPTATPTKKARRAALMTPNTATSSLAALGREALESVLLDLRVEQTSVDAEHFCRLGTITASVLQRLHDQILFELGNGLLEERTLRRDVLVLVFALAGVVVAERQLTTGDDLSPREDHRALDDVLELAHVARPVVLGEPFQCFFADRRRLRRRAVTVLREEVLDERRDVLLAFAQRRHVDVDDVESVKEVVAELVLLDLLLEVLVRRAHDADVDLDRKRRPDSLDLAVLEDAQELGLHREAHLGDLVQEDRALVRELEAASTLGLRAGEAPLLVAEELGLEERLGERRAGHLHEGARAAVRVEVKRLGHELLAGAG